MEQSHIIEEWFLIADINKNGLVDEVGLRGMLTMRGCSLPKGWEEIIYKSFDKDGDGLLNKEEFSAAFATLWVWCKGSQIDAPVQSQPCQSSSNTINTPLPHSAAKPTAPAQTPNTSSASVPHTPLVHTLGFPGFHTSHLNPPSTQPQRPQHQPHTADTSDNTRNAASPGAASHLTPVQHEDAALNEGLEGGAAVQPQQGGVTPPLSEPQPEAGEGHQAGHLVSHRVQGWPAEATMDSEQGAAAQVANVGGDCEAQGRKAQGSCQQAQEGQAAEVDAGAAEAWCGDGGGRVAHMPGPMGTQPSPMGMVGPGECWGWGMGVPGGVPMGMPPMGCMPPPVFGPGLPPVGWYPLPEMMVGPMGPMGPPPVAPVGVMMTAMGPMMAVPIMQWPAGPMGPMCAPMFDPMMGGWHGGGMGMGMPMGGAPMHVGSPATMGMDVGMPGGTSAEQDQEPQF